jgi:hypothetical protein
MMNIRMKFAVAGLCLLLAAGVSATDLPNIVDGGQMIHGRAESFNKASGDTILLMGPTGSGAPYIGDFEGGWNGWIVVDVTQPTESHWQVSNYNQAIGTNLAAWCGDISYAACNDSLDTVGGYGNSWQDLLSYRATVSDPALSTQVNVTATLQNDSEPGYDYTYLSTKIEGSLGFTDVQSWDGKGTFAVANGLTVLPSELVEGTDIYIHFRFESDGGWSDADCSFYGAGACQVDDITVTVSQVGQADIVSSTDFQDGTLGDWFADFPAGVGAFANLWRGLNDLDDCHTNFTQQVAFIDDGVVVPGTGGSDCINWCYGPGGYIVNTIGGLAGPASHLQVNILSPVMHWPNDNYDGIRMAFDVYRHEDLSADAPGVFYIWGVNSADTDGSAGNGVQDLDTQNYLDRAFVYFGGPDYVRGDWDVTDLMNPGRDEIRIQLGVYELGWAFGFIGNDGYPAPYFDNVSVKIFPYVGPGMAAREIDLAQDNFPEVDAINLLDLGSMHVRFDMANNISFASHLRNDPGDSLVMSIVPVRSGADLAGSPEMHYVIDANPVFNAYRTTATSGFVLGVPAVGASGIPSPDRWAFDLPDTGTLFPGDVLHYYVRAGDEVGGVIQYATTPGDITGFGDFSAPLAYNSSFVVRALPSITSDGLGGFEMPPALFWNDFANRGGENEWYSSFGALGVVMGLDYDIYYTNGPSSGVGNGIGGRTSGLALEHYSDLIYTAGDLSVYTISNGDFENDAGDDITALLNWMSAGNKDLLITGDDVVTDLAGQAGAAGTLFSESVMGVNYTTGILRSFIGNQSSPLVMTIAGNPVITNVNNWIAYGGCLTMNSFDGVTPRAGAVRLAEFGDPNNYPGAYAFSAATYNVYNGTNRVVSFPYDFMYIMTNPGAKLSAPLSARAQILSDVLDFFGLFRTYWPTPVPAVEKFAVANYPNPFNPATKISYVVPRAGHLSLKIFNVRGQLVRTLIDGQVEVSGEVMWDGTNNQGGAVSSGVYFYEARLGGEVRISKMALVK